MPLQKLKKNAKTLRRRESTRKYTLFSKNTALIALFVLTFGFFYKALVQEDPATNASLASASQSTTHDENSNPSIDGSDTVNSVSVLPKSLTLTTSQGNIEIELRPNQALESVQYIKSLLDSPEPCKRCRFYRAEQRGILQGILKKSNVLPNKVLGTCPDGFKDVPKCHGPLMTRGMVGWAAGEGGPDFFIDNYSRPADWWNNDHTVWGEIVDEESLRVVDSFFDLPRHTDGLTYLDKHVPIGIE